MVEEGLPDGWTVTLALEAQWERAAHGPFGPEGDDARFPWGLDWRPGAANCDGGTRPYPVGLCSDGASPEGVWDMAGNVSERCLDGFAPPTQPAAGAAVRDPCCADYRFGHVLKGGAFDSPPLNCRVTARFPGACSPAPGERSASVGFRCVSWLAPESLR
jgi:formylglycine-generating enzyme required for sulfatase activity